MTSYSPEDITDIISESACAIIIAFDGEEISSVTYCNADINEDQLCDIMSEALCDVAANPEDNTLAPDILIAFAGKFNNDMNHPTIRTN